MVRRWSAFPGCVCWCNITHPPSCCFQPPYGPYETAAVMARTFSLVTSHWLPARVDRLRSPTLV